MILTFEDGTDPYFAREIVFQRISDAQLPTGVTPSMAPLFSPSGLVYRYVIESPDRTPTELHTYEDWIIERAYRSVPGVADDSGFGGPTKFLLGVNAPLAGVWGHHSRYSEAFTWLNVLVGVEATSEKLLRPARWCPPIWRSLPPFIQP